MQAPAARARSRAAVLSLRPLTHAFGNVLDHEQALGYLLVAPVVLLLLGLVAYPFVIAVSMAMTDRTIGNAGKFIGFTNIQLLLRDSVYLQAVHNTLIYTAGSTVMKVVVGFGLALLINERFRFRQAIRSAVLLPWIVPAALGTLAWLWIFAPSFSVLNWILIHAGIVKTGLPWLVDGNLALFSVILVNAWRGIPFFAITLLAGLQAISQELYEASAIDGAGKLARFWYVTLPLMRPILLITLVLSIIWTFSDFQTVYALTGGGPLNATHLLATLSYQVGIASGRLGEGAAISLTMLPVLFVLVCAQIYYLRKTGSA
ncbi:MAG: sugar ABC transporter permease [Chloroflexi bacterium]|nr:sugar ABC transporter permease [Chloroflexota bacterium]